jgi:hypothetical protein
MPFVKYNPYPDAAFGAGDFEDDQGRSMPMYDPALAQQLVAQNMSVAQPVQQAVSGQQDPNMSVAPSVPDVAVSTAPAPDAIDDVVKSHPGLTREGVQKLIQGEGGMNLSPTTGQGSHRGVLQFSDTEVGPDASVEDRIRYLPKYWQSRGVTPKSDADMYVAHAAPAYVGKPDATVVEEYAPGTDAYEKNPGWRDPATGLVTVGSIKNYSAKQPTPQVDPEVVGIAARVGQPNVTGGSRDTRTTTSRNTGTPFTKEDDAALTAASEQYANQISAGQKALVDAHADVLKHEVIRGEEVQQLRDAAAEREVRARQKYDEGIARVEHARNEVEQDKQPPPFTQQNIFVGILAAVAQGVGAYAAAINKTENFAARLIDKAIEQDNLRWQQQHLDKKYKASELKELNRNQWHDFQSQRLERELQQRMLVDNELHQYLTKVKSAESENAGNLMIAANGQKMEQIRLDMQRNARGKVAIEQTNINTAPTAALPSLEEQNKRAEAEEKSGRSPEKVAEARKLLGGSGDVPVDQKKLHDYTNGTPQMGGRAAQDLAEEKLLSTAKTMGMVFDPQTRTFQIDPNTPDPVPRNPLTGGALSTGILGEYGRPAAGLFHAMPGSPKGATQEQMAEAETQVKSMVADYTKAISGAAASDQERKLHQSLFMGRSRQDSVEQFSLHLKELDSKRRALANEFPGAEEAYNTRNEQKKAANRPPPFTPGVK